MSVRQLSQGNHDTESDLVKLDAAISVAHWEFARTGGSRHGQEGHPHAEDELGAN